MFKIIIVLVFCNTCIFNSEAFFINNKDIRKFFGFAPARLYRIFKKDVDHHEEDSEEEYEHIYTKGYPQNVNEKLRKYTRGKPTDHLDLEDSNKHENIESYSKSKDSSKSKINKETHQEDAGKIVKVKIVNDDEKKHNDEGDYSKLLLVVPERGHKHYRHDDYLGEDHLNYFKGYPESYHDDFHTEPSYFY